MKGAEHERRIYRAGKGANLEERLPAGVHWRCGCNHSDPVGGDLMYYCDCCQNLFNETELVRSFDRDYGWVSECPYCHSAEDFFEVKRCEQCGTWTDKDELASNNGICELCASKTLKEITNLILTKFSYPQIAFLRELVDEQILK